MAYAASNSTAPNPPLLALQPMALGKGSTFHGAGSSAGVGGKVFVYISTHTQAEVGTSDFIGEGTGIGIRAGDKVINMQIGAKHSDHRVTAVGTTFTSLSAGLVTSSAS